jgi:hypothetical protein
MYLLDFVAAWLLNDLKKKYSRISALSALRLSANPKMADGELAESV